jgi:hypothetical protein
MRKSNKSERRKRKMKLSIKILQPLSPCRDGMEWYKKNGEPKTVEGCVKKLIADTRCTEHLNYANWLLSKMLMPDDKIRYAIFAAEQVLYIFEKSMPGDLRPRKAIEAARKYLKLQTPAVCAAGAAGAEIGRAHV